MIVIADQGKNTKFENLSEELGVPSWAHTLASFPPTPHGPPTSFQQVLPHSKGGLGSRFHQKKNLWDRSIFQR